MTTNPAHPAKFHGRVMELISERMDSYLEEPDSVQWILDPFAGTGGIHATVRQFRELRQESFVNTKWVSLGVEIEPDWALQSPGTLVGNALNLPFPNDTFAAIVTSPCYGNRMADHHNARDNSKRHTYRHYLGHDLNVDNAGAMQWGDQYRQFHEHAWAEIIRVLKFDGYIFLNISDHIRRGERQRVTDWHVKCIEELGFSVFDRDEIETPRMKQGANSEARVEAEEVIVFGWDEDGDGH